MRYKNDNELLYLISENNEEATELFYEKYKSSIETISKKYYKLAKTAGIELNDLYQEGMLGLATAIETYKNHKDTKFSTFANLCIKRSIISYIRQNTNIKHKSLNNSLPIDTPINPNSKSLIEILKDTNNIDPEQIYISSEQEDEILERVRGILTELESDVFLLRIKGFSYQEIAMLLNITKKSAEHSMKRVRDKIEKMNKDID